MTDNWGHYFAAIGDFTASIPFDDGFSHAIKQAAKTLSRRIDIPLKDLCINRVPFD